MVGPIEKRLLLAQIKSLLSVNGTKNLVNRNNMQIQRIEKIISNPHLGELSRLDLKNFIKKLEEIQKSCIFLASDLTRILELEMERASDLKAVSVSEDEKSLKKLASSGYYGNTNRNLLKL